MRLLSSLRLRSLSQDILAISEFLIQSRCHHPLPPPQLFICQFHLVNLMNNRLTGLCTSFFVVTWNRAEDFMRRYMWPNSCLPSATALISAAQTASQGRFTLEGVENHAARK